MFNRQPFNRGKFNRPVGGKSEVSGHALIRLSVSSPEGKQDISSPVTLSQLKMGTKADNYAVLYNSGSSEMRLHADLTGIKTITGSPQPSILVMDTSGSHALQGESLIKILSGLSLMPGDELVIDTCEMTVTVNGINSIRYLSSDSDFFELRPGQNEIVYTDGMGSRKVSLEVLWKDRWV